MLAPRRKRNNLCTTSKRNWKRPKTASDPKWERKTLSASELLGLKCTKDSWRRWHAREQRKTDFVISLSSPLRDSLFHETRLLHLFGNCGEAPNVLSRYSAEALSLSDRPRLSPRTSIGQRGSRAALNLSTRGSQPSTHTLASGVNIRVEKQDSKTVSTPLATASPLV